MYQSSHWFMMYSLHILLCPITISNHPTLLLPEVIVRPWHLHGRKLRQIIRDLFLGKNPRLPSSTETGGGETSLVTYEYHMNTYKTYEGQKHIYIYICDNRCIYVYISVHIFRTQQRLYTHNMFRGITGHWQKISSIFRFLHRYPWQGYMVQPYSTYNQQPLSNYKPNGNGNLVHLNQRPRSPFDKLNATIKTGSPFFGGETQMDQGDKKGRWKNMFHDFSLYLIMEETFLLLTEVRDDELFIMSGAKR